MIGLGVTSRASLDWFGTQWQRQLQYCGFPRVFNPLFLVSITSVAWWPKPRDSLSWSIMCAALLSQHPSTGRLRWKTRTFRANQPKSTCILGVNIEPLERSLRTKRAQSVRLIRTLSTRARLTRMRSEIPLRGAQLVERARTTRRTERSRTLNLSIPPRRHGASTLWPAQRDHVRRRRVRPRREDSHERHRLRAWARGLLLPLRARASSP